MSDDLGSFTPGTGLKSDFDGTIRDAMFTVDPASGRASLILEVDCNDGEEWIGRYSVGNDWDTFDGGETVQHPRGDGQRFNSSTAYSDFIVHAVESGAKDILLAKDKEFNGQEARHAATWRGLSFHWVASARPSRTQNAQGVWEASSVNRTLPVTFRGALDTRRAAPAPSATTDPLSGLDAVTAGKVRKAAREAGDYNAFVDAMLGLTDDEDVPIMERLDIGVAVADESWYKALHDS